MSAQPTATNDLHLPSLSITGFRGIDHLEISRLGRVTLFAGKNGVGKTTLLDAVRVYAARGRACVLTEILQDHEDLVETFNEDGDEQIAPNWDALFHGRGIALGASISIGWGEDDTRYLIIENSEFREQDYEQWDTNLPDYYSDTYPRVLKSTFQSRELTTPVFPGNWRGVRLQRDSGFPPVIKCTLLGPGLMPNRSMSSFWDSATLADDSKRAVEALNLVFSDTVQDVVVIGDSRYSRHGRRAVVKIEGQNRLVPLKSLGDGAVRLFGVALALANSKDGFLLIDEAENGIHHSVQRDFWTMVLQTAQANNVQVLATTHGWNCVAGFVQAADALPEIECALVRIERDGDDVSAVEYPAENLGVIAEQGIEVR